MRYVVLESKILLKLVSFNKVQRVRAGYFRVGSMIIRWT
jgi:hypothetical protein